MENGDSCAVAAALTCEAPNCSAMSRFVNVNVASNWGYFRRVRATAFAQLIEDAFFPMIAVLEYQSERTVDQNACRLKPSHFGRISDHELPTLR
jgi:hypothetical protein